MEKSTYSQSHRDAPGIEIVPDSENKTIQEVAAQFNRLQLKNFNEHMHCYRGTHLKTQGVGIPYPWMRFETDT